MADCITQHDSQIAALRRELESMTIIELHWKHRLVFGRFPVVSQPQKANLVERIIRHRVAEMAE